MDKILFINIICIIPALFATFVQTIHKEEKWKFKFDYKIVFFYYCSVLFIVSSFKTMVGYHNVFMKDSFSEIGIMTFMHYFPIVIFLAVFISIVVRLLAKKWCVLKAIYYFDSIFFFLWSLSYYISGGVYNVINILIFFISLLTSVIVVLGMKKKNINYINRKGGKNNNIYISSVILFGIFTSYIYIPQETFIVNINEMMLSHQVYTISLAIGCIVLALMYIGGAVFLLTERQFEVYAVIFFGINFMGYIQTNFLNGKMRALDGQIQKWDSKTVALNILIWIIVIVMFIIARFVGKYKEKTRKLIQIIAIYITLMQIVSLAVLLLGIEKEPKEEVAENYIFSRDYMLELNPENNVIVFVLDWMDQQILEEVVRRDNTVLDDFSGFTWYKNATSKYAFTYMSIPYLMTGIEWQVGMDEYSYYDYAIDNSDFLSSIHDSGYNIGIYSDNYFANKSIQDYVDNVFVDENELVDKVATFDLGEKSARYRMAPFAIKSKFVYYDWEFSELQYGNKYMVSSDYLFMEDLKYKGITIFEDEDNSKGGFRLYHMNGAHYPFNTDSNGERCGYDASLYEGEARYGLILNQARGCLKIVSTYIEEMKKIGLFENSTIIITADHGQNLYLKEEERTDDMWKLTSAPIMLVKCPGEKEGEEIKISNAPVSHQEVIAQVLNSVGIENNMKTFSDFSKEEVRERTFIYGRSADIPFRKYIISGDAQHEDSWKEVPLQ